MSGTVSAKSLIGELKRKRPISPLAGTMAPKEMLMGVALLEREYFERRLDTARPNQLLHLDALANEAQQIVDNALL